MYYLVTWKNLQGTEMSMRVDPKDVTRLVAVLISSVKPGTINIKLVD